MNIEFAAGKLGFQMPGITLQNASPSAHLLVGEKDSPYRLTSDAPFTSWKNPRLTPLGNATVQHWRWQDTNGFALEFRLSTFDNLPGFTLGATFYNGSRETVRLKDISLLQTQGVGLTCAGNPDDWYLSTPGYSRRLGTLAETLPSENQDVIDMWAGFKMPVPVKLPEDERHTDGRWRSYTDFISLYARDGRGMVAGAVGIPEADIRFEFRVDRDGRMIFGVISQMSEVQITPGGSREAQETLFLSGPYNFANDQMLRWVAATHGSRTHRGPRFGWCSWYDLYSAITEESILATIDAIHSQGTRLPMQVIQIDDGFQRTIGDWECNEKFPHGWQPIVQAIHATGAEAGIWLAPLAVQDSLGWLDSHPNWFQRDGKGELLGEVNNWGPKGHWLDPTHPEVQDFIRRLIRQKRAEGFTYFKIDFNEISSDCRFYNPVKTRLNAFRDLYQLYREEIGEDGYLLACSGFTRGVVGYADATRIGPDSDAQWSAAHSCTILEAIRTVGRNAAANRIWFANDPDVTYAKQRRELTQGEWQTWHSFVGLLGGMALVSEPLQKPEYQEAIRSLEILNPPVQERGTSLTASTDREHQEFGFLVQRPWGDFACILLWNPSDQPADLILGARGICLPEMSFHVWSFWDETYLGIANPGLRIPQVPAHSPVLLRLSMLPVKDHSPVLVGSNLHIGMGSAELADVASNRHQMDIHLTDAGARDGALYIYSRHGLTLQAFEGCDSASLEPMGEKLWKVTLIGRQRSEKQALHLKTID